MDKLRGVNLGEWLVIEKWMDENLFSGTEAMDETYLCIELGKERAKERLKVHRDEFITERDFEDISVKGFNSVRIPVPFSSSRMQDLMYTVTNIWTRHLTGHKNMA